MQDAGCRMGKEILTTDYTDEHGWGRGGRGCRMLDGGCRMGERDEEEEDEEEGEDDAGWRMLDGRNEDAGWERGRRRGRERGCRILDDGREIWERFFS